MATSGSFRTYGYSDYGFPDRYVFSWSLVSQSIEGNYSDISWKLYGDGDNSSGNFTIVKEKYVTVNGSTQSNASEQYTYNGTTPFSGTARIYHNADGTGSFSASAGGAFFYYGSYNSTGSGSWSLPTIPRASSVSGGSGNIGGTTTINISRASSSFTHTLEYAFGSLSGTIATGVGTSYNWTIPTSFYAQIPNANSGTGTITCKTYNGSTLIGTKTCSFTVNVINSNPTVGTFTYKDSNSVTTAISENNQRIIRNNSNLLFTIGSATAKNSATISKYEIIFNGVTKSRTSAGDLDFGTINLSSNANATLKVTDSRGNTSTKNITIIIDDWVLPTALISLKRKNNYYSETYIKVDGTCSSLNGKNSMGIQYQYKKVSDKNFSEFYNLEDNVETTVSLDNNYQWNISVVITDRIGQTTYNLVLDRGMPIIFFDRIKNSVGINCFPTNNENLEINDYNLPISKTEDNINGFDGVGKGERLNKSGLYTVCDYQGENGIWYNLFNLRHRSGYDDGISYGMQIRQKMIGYSDKLQVRQQNNGTWGGWRNIQEEPVTLFENASGTMDNITLSESAGNFSFMEIFYVDNNGRSNNSVRVHSPQLKNVELSCIEPASSNSPMRTYIRSSLWIINGTSITHDKSTFTTLSSSGIEVTNNQYIKIYRVVGYR